MDDKQNLTTKLDELKFVYQQNENSILGLYRKLEVAKKQVEDCERQIREGNHHQQGILREIDDLQNLIHEPEKVPVEA